MSLIIGVIGPEHLELCVLELIKLLYFTLTFFYTLASTIVSQSAPNLVKIYMTIRSWISWIMGLIGVELSRTVRVICR